ncbi:MAG TPA: hypothetical protein DE176_04660, partial [Clostridiales bacterium]|nr:hypothetical protein [Clostridiales bacterium]
MRLPEIPSAVAERLLGSGCPAIRYQISRDFHSPAAPDEDLRHTLAQSNDVQRLLQDGARLALNKHFSTVHGSTNHHLENILPMLLDRGVDASFPAFRQSFQPLLEQWNTSDFAQSHCFCQFENIVLAPFLLEAGFRDENLMDFTRRRLDLVSAFCGRMDFDLFGEQASYKGIPKAFQSRRVIRPELYENGAYQFPLIYDLYAYRAIYREAAPRERAQIDAVVRYVMADAYQRFPKGYG